MMLVDYEQLNRRKNLFVANHLKRNPSKEHLEIMIFSDLSPFDA